MVGRAYTPSQYLITFAIAIEMPTIASYARTSRSQTPLGHVMAPLAWRSTTRHRAYPVLRLLHHVRPRDCLIQVDTARRPDIDGRSVS